MIRYQLKILLILSSIVGLIILWPVSKSSMFYGLEHDCSGQAQWMYDRMFYNPSDVDLAFIGSSRTMNGINDQLIEQESRNLKVLNFGYCRYGRNLDYVLIRELIRSKGPERIVLELRESDNPYSHPVFPYLASNIDLISSYPFFNKDLFSDYSMFFQYRLQLIQEEIWGTDTLRDADLRDFGMYHNTDTAAPEELAQVLAKEEAFQPSEWKRAFDMVYPTHYINRISRLCEKHHVELIYLYLPAYGSEDKTPYQLKELQAQQRVLIPPPDILNDPNLWQDPIHMNRAGADRLSFWLVSQL